MNEWLRCLYEYVCLPVFGAVLPAKGPGMIERALEMNQNRCAIVRVARRWTSECTFLPLLCAQTRENFRGLWGADSAERRRGDRMAGAAVAGSDSDNQTAPGRGCGVRLGET